MRASHQGFSLIEVVLALGIISFAIVGAIGLMPIAVKSAGHSMRETDATLIARGIFSAIQSGEGAVRWMPGIAGGVDLSVNGTNSLNFSDNGSVANVQADYLVEILVETNTGTTSLSRVQVDVSYPPSAPAENRTTNSFVTLIGF